MNAFPYLALLLPLNGLAFDLPSRSITTFNHRIKSKSPRILMPPLQMSGSSMPNEAEIAQQKAETYKALSSFHETDADDSTMAKFWECKEGAISYAVPIDPAAGLKKGVISKPYQSSVQIQTNMGYSQDGRKKRGLRLIETIQFPSKDEASTSLPFVRAITLGANFDADAVDGSYSLDDVVESDDSSLLQLPLLPASLMGSVNPDHVKFLVEHTIAVTDSERSRCFLLYGNTESDTDTSSAQDNNADEQEKGAERNYRLLGVVLAEECKKLPDNTEAPKASDSISSLLSTPQPSSPSSPLDLLRVDNTADQRMDKLYDAINRQNERIMSEMEAESEDTPQPKFKRHSPGLFGITSGVYLGDTFIREPILPKSKIKEILEASRKGFGKKPEVPIPIKDDEEDRFATWELGVQKTAIRFKWDYSTKISQTGNYGKSMGTMNSFSCTPMFKSAGTVVVNEGRATKTRAERRVVWIADGDYIAGLIGTGYFRVRIFFLELLMVFFIPYFSSCDSSSVLTLPRLRGTCLCLNHH